MGPRGGNVVVIMQPKNLNPEDVKRVVDQLTEDSSSGSGSGRSSGGSRRTGGRRR